MYLLQPLGISAVCDSESSLGWPSITGGLQLQGGLLFFNPFARVAFYCRWPSITGGLQLQVLRYLLFIIFKAVALNISLFLNFCW